MDYFEGDRRLVWTFMWTSRTRRPHMPRITLKRLVGEMLLPGIGHVVILWV